MKKPLLLLLAPLLAAPVQAQVGFSLQVGQPGFYGQLNVGSAYPRPQLIYTQPQVIERRRDYAGAPIYLRVPPGHAKNWDKHCYRYSACDRPVYFVRDEWYEDVYVPRYRALQADWRDERDFYRDKDDFYRGKKYKKNKYYRRW
jgi:hypothetical protein